MLVVTIVGISGMFGSPDKTLGLFLITREKHCNSCR
jgi:hypothetical protein